MEGLDGNEDVGQMSAWYVLASIGIHPVCPGDTRYELTSPVFKRVTVHLPDGKDFVIDARGNSEENIYISSASLNGRPLDGTYIYHSDLLSGGTLTLNMSSEPSR